MHGLLSAIPKMLAVTTICLSSAVLHDHLWATAAAAEETAQEIELRRKGEAVSLFERVMMRNAGLGRCQISSEWSGNEDYRELSEKQFGLALLPPPATVPEVIDPRGKHRDAFCTSEEFKAHGKKLVAAFRQRPSATNKRHAPVSRHLTIPSTIFAFPAFDKDYARAAIIMNQVTGRINDRDNTEKLEGFVKAEIYVKREGIWRFESDEQLYTFN